MAGLGGLLLVSVSVGLSNFAGAIGIGLSGIDVRTRIRVGIAFGVFEALMPVAGLLIGTELAGRLGGFGRYIGAVMLIVTGIYTVIQGMRQNSGNPGRSGGMSSRTLIVTSVALSIDNLVVGFALGVYRINILLAAGVMAAVSVAMSLLGLELGSRLGARIERWSEELSGAVLVAVGGAIALGVL